MRDVFRLQRVHRQLIQLIRSADMLKNVELTPDDMDKIWRVELGFRITKLPSSHLFTRLRKISLAIDSNCRTNESLASYFCASCAQLEELTLFQRQDIDYVNILETRDIRSILKSDSVKLTSLRLVNVDIQNIPHFLLSNLSRLQVSIDRFGTELVNDFVSCWYITDIHALRSLFASLFQLNLEFLWIHVSKISFVDISHRDQALVDEFIGELRLLSTLRPTELKLTVGHYVEICIGSLQYYLPSVLLSVVGEHLTKLTVSAPILLAIDQQSSGNGHCKNLQVLSIKDYFDSAYEDAIDVVGSVRHLKCLKEIIHEVTTNQVTDALEYFSSRIVSLMEKHPTMRYHFKLIQDGYTPLDFKSIAAVIIKLLHFVPIDITLQRLSDRTGIVEQCAFEERLSPAITSRLNIFVQSENTLIVPWFQDSLHPEFL